MGYENRRILAEKSCRKAADVIKGIRMDIHETTKGVPQNAVTKADTEAERAIVEMIHSEFPDDEVLGEEFSPGNTGRHKRVWIIDPLDGTNNYANGIPQYAVSIAYAEEGDVKIGVIYDPERDELFSAVKGMGARLNSKEISVSGKGGNAEALIATGFYYDRGEVMEQTLKTVRVLFDNGIRGIRRMGSAALDLAWTGCGRFDAYFEYQLSVWDYAAGILIVKEAGGVCMDVSGRDLSLESGGVIASNRNLSEWIKHVVSI
ncbi:MAG: inositol monophosphatase family protein [Chitinivibrionales bacterium]